MLYISKIAEIPCDYYGVMAVPVRIFDFNLDGYKIIGVDGSIPTELPDELGEPLLYQTHHRGDLKAGSKTVFTRIFIQRLT